MTGNESRPEGTPASGAPEAAAPAKPLRRIDSPHALKPRHTVRIAPDELPASSDASHDAPATSDEADSLACDQVADRLLSTQAAQLAEYLRNRQSDLVRRQQQLEEQQQSLQRARQAFEAQRSLPAPPPGGPANSAASPSAAEDAIQLLLETLERQRLAHQAALNAAMGRTTASAANPRTPATTPDLATATSPPSSVPEASGTRPATAQEHPAREVPNVLEQSSEALLEREAQIARQTAATQQLLMEVRRVHEQTLEARFAIEQLWLQLAGRMPHDELNCALTQLREQFQQHHRQSQEELAVQQRESRELLARLEQRQSHLRRQRRDLQTWVDRRYQEFDQLAGQLLVRQQDLDRQQRRIDEQRRHYESVLLQYQQQIKQLTTQLRCREELDRVA